MISVKKNSYQPQHSLKKKILKLKLIGSGFDQISFAEIRNFLRSVGNVEKMMQVISLLSEKI